MKLCVARIIPKVDESLLSVQWFHRIVDGQARKESHDERDGEEEGHQIGERLGKLHALQPDDMRENHQDRDEAQPAAEQRKNGRLKLLPIDWNIMLLETENASVTMERHCALSA